MNWIESAGEVRWNVRPFINGQYRSSKSSNSFEAVNPATEKILYHAAEGSANDINEAVAVARQRFNDGCWSELPPVRRAEILLRLATLLVEHKNELALLDTLEIGKPIQASLYDAEVFAPSLLRSCAGFATQLVGTSAPMDSRTMTFNIYEPRGVVGAITPWNFPVVNAVFKLGPALAAGNTMVLKPSELSSSSALKLAELAVQAGVPEGVLNVVPGLGSTAGAALATHSDVDMISFTGSTVSGRKIMELSGRSNGKPLLLECGGKSPQLVFNDVSDLNRVAGAIVKSFLWNQGQVCSAHTRVIVQQDVKGALLDKIIRLAEKYVPGNPLEEATIFGPLASPRQRDRVRDYVEQGLNAGAVAVLKGRIQNSGGCYVSPTIFDRVQNHMSIVQDEIFGPVLCVQEFKTEAEAIALANGTDYGLVATAWTRDMGRGKRLAHAIRAGMISVRTSDLEAPDSGCVLDHEPQKASGFGSEMGIRGLQSYSTLKWVGFSGA